MLQVLLILFAGAVFASPSLSSDALHRGNLSLAWDAHDSGRFAEALDYLDEIPGQSAVAGRAAWLRAECWYDLGEYSRAVAALCAPEAAGAEGREEFLRDIYWDQVWHATRQEEYGAALQVLAKAQHALPDDPDLAALAAATHYRQNIATSLSMEGSSGGEVQLLPRNRVPPGDGWLRVHPWQGEGAWVPQSTVEDWMPSVAGRARDQGQVLWVRLSVQELVESMTQEAASAGLALRQESWGWSVGSDGEWFPLDQGEWRFRAAVEGLGPRGAARYALRWASVAIADQAALVSWVQDHRGSLILSRGAAGLELYHPASKRSFTLDPGRWADWLRADPDSWRGFWRDLSTELGRPARPYHCFCGRSVVLREVLIGDPGRLLEVGREDPVAVVVAALCPEHLRYVEPDLLTEWGISRDELLARARSDARDNPWQLEFGRGEVDGVPYLYLEGEGASSLVRAPGLLLGALEGIDGYAARGTAVRVYAATGSTLVVVRTDAPEGVPRLAAARLLLERARHGAVLDGTRLEYRTTLHLPRKPQGTFRLTPAE